MRTMKLLSSEDAVSEVIDFVTILGILVLSIGIIGVAGYPIVKSAQEANHIENTKQSFIVLAGNINKVALGQAPSQSVELKMYGGTLSVTGNSTIKINATNSSNMEISLVDQQMRSIESTVGDTVIAYEGTGVWAKYPNNKTVLVYKPLITNRSNVVVIPVVKISGSSSMGGSGMSRVTAKGVPSVVFYGNVSNIRININSSYADGWQKGYFESIMNWTICTNKVDCTSKLGVPDNIDVYILNIQLDTEVV
ncbi:MAG: hypothetical protein Q8N79_02415 [Candidatus Methanoperedens sp.]|nr:hypothetical protein [Candidatus Methanoperedens sp.]